MSEREGTAGRERRLRLTGVEAVAVGEFRWRARVVLEDPRGGVYEGSAELPRDQQNVLRAASQATLIAIGSFLQGAVELKLLGLRSLRVFDTPIVAVRIASRAGERERHLLGIAVAGEDPASGAARAILHATNRLIGNFVER